MASPPKRQKLTEFAEIYSHPIGYTTGVHHDEIAYDVPYKSGLTPVNLGAGFTEQDRERAVALEGYQMSRLESTDHSLQQETTILTSAQTSVPPNWPPSRHCRT